MRVCVFGAGAIGGMLAARLVKGGAETAVVARGPHLRAIQQDGLRVRADGVETVTRPTASDDPAVLGVQDLVVVTVKAPALPSVATTVAPLLGPDTAVVFAMNGIPWWYFQDHPGPLDGKRLPSLDPGEALRRAVAPDRVLGGVVYSYAEMDGPGIVRLGDMPGRLILGRPDGAASAPAAALVAALGAGGLAAEVTGRIRDRVWSKLMGNLASGPLSVLTGAPMATALSETPLEHAAGRVLHEVAAIARALGCDPGPVEASLPILRRSQHRTSILQDLELGRPMEVDALCTVPLHLAALTGVAAPTLELLTSLVMVRARQAGLYG